MPLVAKYKYRNLTKLEVKELGSDALTMRPARRLRPLVKDELATLTKERLLDYRKKALSLENCLEKSDYHDQNPEDWDPSYVYFKDDPRWGQLYETVLRYLA